MNYAFFSFVRQNEHRKKFLNNVDTNELEEIFILLEIAKLANIRKGKENSFYGKTHSPETLAKIKETKAKNGTNKGPRNPYIPNNKGKVHSYNVETKIKSFTFEEDIPEGNVMGNYQNNYSKLKLSLRLRETFSNMESKHWIKYSKDNAVFETVWVNKDGINVRARPDEIDRYLLDGYVLGIFLDDDIRLLKNSKISNAHFGRVNHWQDKINKNPEKIRKTAEKNTGSKRTDEQRSNISAAVQLKYDSGELVSHAKGKTWFYNPNNYEEFGLFFDCPSGWVSGNPKTKGICYYNPQNIDECKRFNCITSFPPEGWLKGNKKLSLAKKKKHESNNN